MNNALPAISGITSFSLTGCPGSCDNFFRPSLISDCKIAEVRGGLNDVLIELIYPAVAVTCLEVINKAGQVFFSALRFNFNFSVQQVFHPAGQLAFQGFLSYEMPEPNALDVAGNQ